MAIKKCVYCGSEQKLTSDHIPPKSIFPKPRPRNLVTVPCCKSCNSNYSKDDTYFRDMICLRQEIGNNPYVQKLLPLVVRSITRKESQRYFGYIYSRMAEKDVFTTTGLWVGKQPTVVVDMIRISRVIERITKGLFYYEIGSILDLPYGVDVMTLEYLNTLNYEQSRLFIKVFLVPILEVNFQDVGSGIFKYRFRKSDNPNCTIWQFVFYDKVPIYSITLPLSEIKKKNIENKIYPPIWIL